MCRESFQPVRPFPVRTVGDLCQGRLVEVFGEDLAMCSHSRGETKREIAIAGTHIGDSTARCKTKLFHDLNRPLPRIPLGSRGKSIGRRHLRKLPVKLLRSEETGRNIAGAVDHIQVGRTVHVIELGDRARIGLAVAELGPENALLRGEALHFGRFVIEGDTDNLEPLLLVFPVELLE